MPIRPLLLVLPLVFAACQVDAPADAPPDLAAEVVTPPRDTVAPAAEPALLNLNTATEAEFAALPGVGDRMAHEFVEYRPYTSVRVFRQEIGKYISDDADRLAAYERAVFVPVVPDSSDAETLAQLPGLDAATAGTLAEGRPYGSDDAFLDRYAALVPGADREAARRYLGR